LTDIKKYHFYAERLEESNGFIMKHQFPPNTIYNEDEEKQIKEWNRKHDRKCPILKNHKDKTTSPYGTIGGGRTYTFTPTSIGTIMTIECACGEEFVIDNNL
jgi:hypothetical protein